MPHRARALAFLLLALSACRPVPFTTAVPEALNSAPACPAPSVQGVRWMFVDDSLGFSIAMPRGFVEKPSGGPSRSFESPGDLTHSMASGVIRGNLGLAGYRRFYQAVLMLDYSECEEVIAGYHVSIQAWRTPNGVFRNFKRSDRFDVFAILEISPDVYFYVSGGTDLRSVQDQILSSLRMMRHRMK